MQNLRIGQGYDVHKLTPDRDLYLCGVKIPHTLGLLGHSDADVAIHALCDAILGALALGDIGTYFPDTDPRYKGISSMWLLEQVVGMMHRLGWRLINADVTIIAQKPKILPYIEPMRRNLSTTAAVDVSCINVKATTTERLGFEGREEGISAMAVVLIVEGSN